MYIDEIYKHNFKRCNFAPNIIGGQDLKFNILGRTQLERYYKYDPEIGEEHLAILPTSWRYLHIIAVLAQRNSISRLGASVFNVFNFPCTPIKELFDTSKKYEFYTQPVNQSNNCNSCIFIIEEPEDNLHVKVTLWVSKISEMSYEQLRFDIENDNFRNYAKWEGVARFRKFVRSGSDEEDIFKNHSLVAILREYHYDYPGVLKINSNVSEENEGHYKCHLHTPYSQENYEISSIRDHDT